MAATGVEHELEGKHGKLIALEGNTNVLSIQLKLLPLSPKILVIPSVSENITNDEKFNARDHIRRAHIAFAERTDRARAFLSSSTRTHPRLVFMNGGSVSARSDCIARISENVTDGDVIKAEDVFNEIVKDGVAGLMRNTADDNDGQTLDDLGRCEKETVGEEEPSSSRVKEAVNSLERDTAAPQLDAQGHSSSQVGATEATQSADGPPRAQNVFTTAQGDKIVRTVLTVREKRGTFGPGHKSIEKYKQETEAPSPELQSIISVPTSPRVVYGEARIVDIASASPTRIRRKSIEVDRFYPSKSLILPPSSIPRPKVKHTQSAHNLGLRPGTPEPLVPMLPLDLGAFHKFSGAIFAKGSETTIRRSPASSTSNRSVSSFVRHSQMFADRGTDTEDLLDSRTMHNTEEKFDHEESEPFVPVFPVVEDFILQLFDGKPDKIVESVVRSAKDGTYPSPFLPTSPAPKEQKECEAPKSPVSPTIVQDAGEPNGHLQVKEGTEYNAYATDDFDPYSSDEYPPDNIQRSWSQYRSASKGIPPTPTTTPPLPHGAAEKFVDFCPPDAGNAINVQNSLRKLLGDHFPAEEYSQQYHAVPPELNRLWKPVFRYDERPSIGNEGSTVDLIVALGSEEGVKKDFFHQISGQMEKLGTKRDGTSRSGKLDIGYLIGNALQGLDGSSFSLSASSNPFANPTLLAVLLVPHIEAFLASNASTRFLILHYPANQLETVLALRKLLGSEMFMMGGILDSLASDPPSSRPMTPTAGRPQTSFSVRPPTPLTIRPQSPVNPLSNEAVAARNTPTRLDSFGSTRQSSLLTLKKQASRLVLLADAHRKVSSAPSFSNADILLPSTATDGEITAFLSVIWRSLMDKSAFYIPEPEPKTVLVGKAPPLPPTPSTSPIFTRDAGVRDSAQPSSFRGSSAKISHLTGTTAIGSRQSSDPSITTLVKHRYASSLASIKTTATERSRKKVAAPTGGEGGWDNFYIEDDDSEDDEYDKMIMGRSMARIVPEVKNPDAKARDKKKALKWLGLA